MIFGFNLATFWRLRMNLTNLLPVGSSKLLFNILARGFWLISGLYILLDSNQTFFEGIKTWWIKHFLLDFGGIRTPTHQKQFLFFGLFICAFALMLVLEIVQPITAIFRSSWKDILQEVFIGVFPLANLFYSNSFFVFDEKDHIAMTLLLLDVIIFLFNLFRHLHARSLKMKSLWSFLSITTG